MAIIFETIPQTVVNHLIQNSMVYFFKHLSIYIDTLLNIRVNQNKK